MIHLIIIPPNDEITPVIMCSSSQYLEDAVAAAKRAVEFDNDGKTDAAVYFYNVSSKLLTKAAYECEDKKDALIAKAEEYSQRAAALEESKDRTMDDCRNESIQIQKQYKFLMQQALDADGAGVKDTAIELYSNAIEYVTKHPELMQGELKELALNALDRAETLKGTCSFVCIYFVNI